MYLHKTQFARIEGPFLAWEFQLTDANGQTLALIDRNFQGFAKELFTDAGEPPQLGTLQKIHPVVWRCNMDKRLTCGQCAFITVIQYSQSDCFLCLKAMREYQ